MSKKSSSSLSLVVNEPARYMVHDQLEIQRTLDRAAGNSSEVVFQLTPSSAAKGGSSIEKFSARIVEYLRSKKTFRLSLPGGDEFRLFTLRMRQDKNRPFMILIYLKGQTVVGVMAKPQKVDSEGIEFALPTRMYKVQRRKRERFEIPQGYEFMVEFTRPGNLGAHRRKLINLSTEGLAFRVVTSREAQMFKPGMVLRDLRIMLQGAELVMDAVVRSHGPNGARGGGFKVGVEITQIEPQHADYLAGFLLQQMSQFVS
jgi:c-di-GMP-binding flagellar brake protein YcgR